MSFLGQAILNSKSVCSQIFVYSMDKKIDSFHSKLSETLMYLSKVKPVTFLGPKSGPLFVSKWTFPDSLNWITFQVITFIGFDPFYKANECNKCNVRQRPYIMYLRDVNFSILCTLALWGKITKRNLSSMFPNFSIVLFQVLQMSAGKIQNG